MWTVYLPFEFLVTWQCISKGVIFFLIWLPTTVGPFLSINQLLILTISNIKQVFSLRCCRVEGSWLLIVLGACWSSRIYIWVNELRPSTSMSLLQWSINFLYNFFRLLYLVFAWVPPFIFTIASVLAGVNSAISWNTTGQNPSLSLSHTHTHT